jgi:hypothetical protein
MDAVYLVQARVDTPIRAKANQVERVACKRRLYDLPAIACKEGAILERNIHQARSLVYDLA